jgi:hypothetical protein
MSAASFFQRFSFIQTYYPEGCVALVVYQESVGKLVDVTPKVSLYALASEQVFLVLL